MRFTDGRRTGRQGGKTGRARVSTTTCWQQTAPTYQFTATQDRTRSRQHPVLQSAKTYGGDPIDTPRMGAPGDSGLTTYQWPTTRLGDQHHNGHTTLTNSTATTEAKRTATVTGGSREREW